jgi:uncharacterized membrane protein
MVSLKSIVFGAFGLMLLFVLWNNESFLLDPHSPQWAHFNPIRWHLIPHGTAGFVALALGALQFSTRLRQRYSHLHRLFGKVYICSTFILAPVAIWMAFVNSPWFLIPFTIVQAIVLLSFTSIAYRCIRRADFVHHREWMIRSYSILLIFLEGRVLMAIPPIARGQMDSIVLVNWGCLAVTLVITELYLRRREIFPARTAIAASHHA